MTFLRRLVLPAALALVACAARRIPGTDVRDTSENRAVYEVIQEYGQAMQKKDAAAVLTLVAPDYFDDAGTPDPADDLDRAQLEKTLPQDLAKLDSLRLELTVKTIEAQKDTATADVFYNASYQIQTPTGPIPKRQSDIHRMKFKRLQGQWRIVAGL